MTKYDIGGSQGLYQSGSNDRVLANVMALQAGWPELDFSSWDTVSEDYFSAIQAGVGCHYEPLKILVRQVLNDSESAFLQ